MIIEFWKTGENPITCYNSLKNKSEPVTVKIPSQGKKAKMQPVMIEHLDGKKKRFETVVEAAFELKVDTQVLYNILNKRGKLIPGIKIYKLEK
jgi:hypothetical protein